MRVVFMGSPEFALPTLRALVEQFQVAGVVTQPDRPAGRGRELTPPPVRAEAEKLDVSPVLQPDSLDGGFQTALRDLDPSVIVVAAYGRILPGEILSLPPHGCVNVHASLLPRWRGASPIQAAILHGDDKTGVTIMKMDAGLDTGPIIAQEATPIQADETGGELAERLAILGADLLTESLPPYVAGELALRPQEHSMATNAPQLKKADGRLDFRLPAAVLARQVRAFEPWPGSFLLWKGQRILVKEARAIADDGEELPGVATTSASLPAVQTPAGLLLLESVQPAGKRTMGGRDFLNGAQDFAGSQLPLPAAEPKGR